MFIGSNCPTPIKHNLGNNITRCCCRKCRRSQLVCRSCGTRRFTWRWMRTGSTCSGSSSFQAQALPTRTEHSCLMRSCLPTFPTFPHSSVSWRPEVDPSASTPTCTRAAKCASRFLGHGQVPPGNQVSPPSSKSYCPCRRWWVSSRPAPLFSKPNKIILEHFDADNVFSCMQINSFPGYIRAVSPTTASLVSSWQLKSKLTSRFACIPQVWGTIKQQ